jgi:hypothetical protein
LVAQLIEAYTQMFATAAFKTETDTAAGEAATAAATESLGDLKVASSLLQVGVFSPFFFLLF